MQGIVTRIVVPSLLVAAGLCGWLRLREAPSFPASAPEPEATATWFLHDGDSPDPRYGRPDGSASGVELTPGMTFRLVEEDYELQRYAALTFALAEAAPGTRLHIVLRESTDRSTWLELCPGQPLVARALLHRAGSPDRELAATSASDVLRDPGAAFTCCVRLDGAHLVATLDGRKLLEWDAAGIEHGHMALRAMSGSVRLQRVHANGRQTNQHGEWRDFSVNEMLADSPPAPAWPARLQSLLLASGAALGAALFLAALSRARPESRTPRGSTPSPGAVAGATLVWLAGPSLPLALSLVRPVPSLAPACALFAAASLPLAVARLCAPADAPRAAKGARGRDTSASDAAPGLPAPPAVPAAPAATAATAAPGVSGAGTAVVPATGGGTRVAWRVLALGLALGIGVATAWLCGRRSVQALQPVVERERVAQDRPLAPDWESAEAALDAANALEAPAVRRDMLVTATVRLAPDSALAVRLRAPDSRLPRGVLFTLSADGRLPSGFRHEDIKRFDALAETAQPALSGRPLELELRVRGSRYVALLDGQELAAVEDDAYAAGSVVFLAQRGTVRLTDVKVVSTEPDRRLPSLAAARLQGALLPLAALLWAAGAACWLRASWRGTCVVAACALLPVLATLLLAPRTTFSAGTLLLAGGCATALLAAHALLAGPRARRPVLATTALLLAAGAPWAAGLPLAIDARACVDQSELNRMCCADWEGDHLDGGSLSLQHPLLRRWNDWLARHRFREREVPLARVPGVPRIMTLGGSSTWGFRIPPGSRGDWPAQLEDLLARRGRAEVVNAGFVGATSNRLYHFFSEALLPFAPDVVVLCVSFNDSSSQAQGDEEAYYAAVTGGNRRSWLDDWQAREERERERRALVGVIAELPGSSRSSEELWRAAGMTSSPPARFESVLRRFAELCRQRGMRLVLVKEPVAGDVRLVWKEEFRAAMDRVGVEYGLTVVDPVPALAAAGDRDLFMDRVHLKPSGCAVVAREVARAVTPLLTVRRETAVRR